MSEGIYNWGGLSSNGIRLFWSWLVNYFVDGTHSPREGGVVLPGGAGSIRIYRSHKLTIKGFFAQFPSRSDHSRSMVGLYPA